MGTAFYGYEFGSTQRPLGRLHRLRAIHRLRLNYGADSQAAFKPDGWVRHRDAVARRPYLLYRVQADSPGSSATTMRSRREESNYVLGCATSGESHVDLDADYDGTSQDLRDAMYGRFTGINMINNFV